MLSKAPVWVRQGVDWLRVTAALLLLVVSFALALVTAFVVSALTAIALCILLAIAATGSVACFLIFVPAFVIAPGGWQTVDALFADLEVA